MRTIARIVAVLVAANYLVLGIWAFAAPESFAENIANYPPYNEHLLHDAGAFSIGLGVAALAGLLVSDALAAVLAGVAAASLLHGVSHIMDQELGGRSSDPWTVSAIGLATLCGFVIAMRSRRAGGPPPASNSALVSPSSTPGLPAAPSTAMLSNSATPGSGPTGKRGTPAH